MRTFPQTGARKRVISDDEPRFAASGTAPVDFNVSSGLNQAPGEDQGGSNSCTSQRFGYHFWQYTGLELVRRDIYSHTCLPGGGAYLVAPDQWTALNGILLRGKYQDPDPETENAMEQVIVVQVGDRLRTFQISSPVIAQSNDIQHAAQMIDQYKGIGLGIKMSSDGWAASWTDPTYDGQDDDQHALYGYDHVMRNGKQAILCRSSWCNTTDPGTGQPSAVHYINEDYFNNGGVFEILGTTVKEIDMQFFQVSGESTIVALIGGLYRELATPAELFSYCQQALGIPATLPTVDRATVNANLGKQIVAGITF